MDKKQKTDNLQHLICMSPNVKSLKTGLYIEGYANKNIVDRGKEIIEPDSWNIDNYKKNPVILYNHGMDADLGQTPIGKTVTIEPRKDGLFIKAKISNVDDPALNRIRGLVDEGILKAFSVGFEPLDTHSDNDGVNHIVDAELYEISIVGVPMNQDSLFNITGKSLKTKSVKQIVQEICDKKGALVAGFINSKLEEMNLSKDDFIEKLRELTNIQKLTANDILIGNAEEKDGSIPDTILKAIAEILGVQLEKLKKLNEGIKGDEEQSKDSSTEKGAEDKEAEETSKGDTAENGDKKEDRTHQEKDGKDFQSCVADKIPKLIAEGKDQDQAIAIAISMCQEKEKCAPTKDDYIKFFEFAKKAQDETPTVEIPAATTGQEGNDFGSPYLESIHQTNVLLGSLIRETQKISMILERLQLEPNEPQTAVEVEPVDVNTESEKAKVKQLIPKDDMSREELIQAQKERSSKFKIEITEDGSLTFPSGFPKDLAEYADPVNMKFPVDTEERANNARARFKQMANEIYKEEGSKAQVHDRIVSKQLQFGSKPSYDENDPLDKLLSSELKDELEKQKALKGLLDNYKKRLENIMQRLKGLESL